MSYVDEYRSMVSESRVIFSTDPSASPVVFSYPGYDEGYEVWQLDHETVVFTEDDDWLENDCAG